MLSDVREWLQDSTTVERVTVADDFAQTETWTDVATGVECYIRELDGNEAIEYGQTNVRSTHTLYCDVSVDIQEGDRVVEGTKTYEVRWVDPKTALGDGWLQVSLEYIEAAQ
jgi:head-tail adaptor